MTKAYVRLVAGIKHEPVIQLRSKVADLDADLTLYERGGETQARDPRVALVRKALRHIEIAVNPPLRASFIPEDLWSGFDIDTLSADDFAVTCDHRIPNTIGLGIIGVTSAEMQSAHVARALALLAAADGVPLRRAVPLGDLAVSRARCKISLIEVQWMKINEKSIWGELKNLGIHTAPTVAVEAVLLGAQGEELARLRSILASDFRSRTWHHYKIPITQHPAGWDGRSVRIEVTDVTFSTGKK